MLCFSLNSHKSEVVHTNLLERIHELVENKFIYAIQEPYCPRNRIPITRGISAHYDKVCKAPRAAILYSSKLDMWDVPAFTGRDVTTCLLKTGDPMYEEIYFVSAYMDILFNAKDFIPSELNKIIKYCKDNNKPLIINADSNCHSVLWGPETNPRGELMEEYIMDNDLIIQNIGNAPTFVTNRGCEIRTNIDVTLTKNFDEIKDWKVSETITLSDHKEINYVLKLGTKLTKPKIYLTEKLNEAKFNEYILAKLPKIPEIISKEWVEKSAKKFAKTLKDSFERNCPKKKGNNKVNKPKYWNSDITGARKGARRSYRTYLSNKIVENWDKYKEMRNILRKTIRSSKRKAWQEHCQEIDNIKDMSKMVKATQKSDSRVLGLIRDPTSDVCTPDSTIDILMNTHWPGSIEKDPYPEVQGDKSATKSFVEADESLSYITSERVQWAVNGFGGNKAAGPDGIKPMLLQKLNADVIKYLAVLFRASMALECVPLCWRKSMAIFIPKPGKDSYDNPKAYRPITLSSFIWKTFEKIILDEIETTYLSVNPISKKQHAFRKGSSCDSAMSMFVDKLEKAVYNGKYALGIFLDIQGAFDNLNLMAAIKGLETKRISRNIINHYREYLYSKENSL